MYHSDGFVYKSRSIIICKNRPFYVEERFNNKLALTILPISMYYNLCFPLYTGISCPLWIIYVIPLKTSIQVLSSTQNCEAKQHSEENWPGGFASSKVTLKFTLSCGWMKERHGLLRTTKSNGLSLESVNTKWNDDVRTTFDQSWTLNNLFHVNIQINPHWSFVVNTVMI